MSTCDLIEILEGEGLKPPRTLTLSITGACNLLCEHCLVDAGLSRSAGHVPGGTVRRLVEEFAVLGGQGVRFTGGEPLCHPDWLNFMLYSRRLGFQQVALQTNGMLLEEKDVDALRALDFPGLSVQISLDGASPETHDRVRGNGAFKGALEGIRRLAAAGLSPRIMIFFTEMRHNLHEFPAILELAEEEGIPSVAGGTLVTGGRADGERGSQVAPPEVSQYLDLVQCYETDSRFRDLYGKIGNLTALEWWRQDTPSPQGCSFVEKPYLTPLGSLYPCVLFHDESSAVRGVFEKKLAHAFAEGAPLWSSLVRISRSRSEAISTCRSCPGKLSCAGGCMGRALGSRGDLLATEDRCGLRCALTLKKRIP